MYRGKHSAPRTHRRRRNSALKAALVSFAVCIMVFSVISGSLAWLMTSTDPIVNVSKADADPKWAVNNPVEIIVSKKSPSELNVTFLPVMA